ncbi:peptidyl-tRNA hydrolase II [Panus rudis PR-1116 ss-1]|nr:peptidyl-tRNA hydrolase II [Panus rudis PR-1116 ss-1]
MFVIFTGVILVATSLGIGYGLGVKSAASTATTSNTSTTEKAVSQNDIKRTEPSAEEAGSDIDSDEEDVADGDLAAVKPGFLEPCKLVLVVRTDLGMTTGKIAAQCGHATLACYKALQKSNPSLLKHWERTGQAKIALRGDSEDALLELEAIAKSLNLCARSIIDAGRTQVAARTRTVLGIGPAPVDLVNKVTGKLRLL